MARTGTTKSLPLQATNAKMPKTKVRAKTPTTPSKGTSSASKKSAAKPVKASAPRGLTYAQAGVDIDAGDEVVERIKPIVRRTHSPRVMGLHGAFAGMFRLDNNRKLFKRNYKNPVAKPCDSTFRTMSNAPCFWRARPNGPAVACMWWLL